MVCRCGCKWSLSLCEIVKTRLFGLSGMFLAVSKISKIPFNKELR